MMIHDKVPPQAIDFEEAVLGAIMLEKDALLEVIDILSENTFYLNKHQKIFKAILQLQEKSEAIDILTVTEQLKKNKDLDVVGGSYYISQLTNRAAGAANIEHHARVLKEKEISRDVVQFGTSLVLKAYDPSVDVFDLTDDLMTKAYNIGDIRKGRKQRSVLEVIRDVKKKMELAATQGGVTGLQSGIQKLDGVTRGYQNSDLIIKAARPSMGKTAQALCEALHMTLNQGKNILFFSLEMSYEDLIQRAVSVLSGIPLRKIQDGKLRADEWKRFNHFASLIAESGFSVNDDITITISGILKTAKKHAIKHGLDGVYIDYLQLISGDGKDKGNREQEVSRISRGCKILAKELNIPVIALSQLNRAVESRGGDKIPMLSDLRESGSLEQDADMVQFLHRPEYYKMMVDEEGNSNLGKAILFIAKHRNGACLNVDMKFISHLTKFDNWEESSFKDVDQPKTEAIPFSPTAGIEPVENFYEVDKEDD